MNLRHPNALRKRYKKDAARYPINKALFEAWSVNINRLDDSQLQRLQEQKDMVRERFIPDIEQVQSEKKTFTLR